jgi:hypothetical protein
LAAAISCAEGAPELAAVAGFAAAAAPVLLELACPVARTSKVTAVNIRQNASIHKSKSSGRAFVFPRKLAER